MEIWKAVEGFEGFYEVSSRGRLRNCKTGRIFTQRDCNGYDKHELRDARKRSKCMFTDPWQRLLYPTLRTKQR